MLTSVAKNDVVPLRAKAYENFQQQIVEAQIRPGQFISQRELTQLLGMPLGAVRELIPRLEAEGLLTTVPQRGMQVAQVDIKLIKNAFDLRMLLEKEAALKFCQQASDEQILQIEQAHLKIVKLALKGRIDAKLLSEATLIDWNFHDLMMAGLGNELMAEIHRINNLRVRLIRFERSTLSADALIPAMEEHLWLIDALKKRDTDAVATRLSHHIESARMRVLGLPRPHLPWSVKESL